LLIVAESLSAFDRLASLYKEGRLLKPSSGSETLILILLVWLWTLPPNNSDRFEDLEDDPLLFF